MDWRCQSLNPVTPKHPSMETWPRGEYTCSYITIEFGIGAAAAVVSESVVVVVIVVSSVVVVVVVVVVLFLTTGKDGKFIPLLN
jgi:hypothetical protein